MVAMSAPRRYRTILTAILAVALLASLYVAIVRERNELASRHVEIAMDYGDFAALAQSYGYDKTNFLVALRRAGLTSLAISEELGGNINGGSTAIALPGQTLISQTRLGTLRDPTLVALAAKGRLSADEIYLVVFDKTELARYRTALAAHLGPRAVSTLHAADPTILAIRSQNEYFSSLALGFPAQPLALARALQLYFVPRVQNDERFAAPEIDRIFASFKRGERPSTVVFFGQRSEVLGFPDHLRDTANAFRRSGLNFGSVETYDKNQVQKGNDELALKAIARTTRVQAISKAELDKLDFKTVVARYLLGVRERNVRVVYVRPFLHEQNGMSLEKTNVELVREIATGLRARGFTLGRATPIPGFRINPFVVLLASLAVPAIVVLLFEAFGKRRAQIAYIAFALDALLILGGYVSHHDVVARKLLALIGAIGFATMGFVAVPRSFTLPAPQTLLASVLAGLRTVGVATAFALAGALVVVGLVSTPALMEEIDRFTGVKAVIVVPPLLALGLYIYTRRFGNEPPSPRSSAVSPVLAYQLAVFVVLAGAAFVYVSRSGNQSDVSPTAFELALRSNLTQVLGVRPRFKEFAIGVPLMMLLPALRAEHKRAAGWLFALAIAIGTSDIVDTFSHLHTPLVASLTRVFNGGVIGVALGIAAIATYRAIDGRLRASAARRRLRASP
ncbi:MAG: DUF5693 family protein [Vulcanimicrobiaceae bacterium]